MSSDMDMHKSKLTSWPDMSRLGAMDTNSTPRTQLLQLFPQALVCPSHNLSTEIKLQGIIGEENSISTSPA
jgi:hypothetical protein